MTTRLILPLSLPALLLLLLTSQLQAGAILHSASRDNSVQEVQLAVKRLQQSYLPKTALWNGGGWWNDANSLTAIVDYSRATHSSHYLHVISHTYAVYAPIQFLKNKYYDDEGWWALAWIDAYDLTGNRNYLQTATVIFDDMTTGWDNTCGGGVWWTKDRTYKNAIANELFLSLAAHLANRVTDQSQQSKYSAWAIREWNWFQNSGLIEGDLLINDGLDSQCRNNHKTTWTYNQGVVLGGLTELSRLLGQAGVLKEAGQIADAAIKKLADSNSVLHEPCEPKCGEDGAQFKGIFIRNLALLQASTANPLYARFITANADSLLKNAQAPDHSYGIVWSGPPAVSTAVSQTSAIDALVAALMVRGEMQRTPK